MANSLFSTSGSANIINPTFQSNFCRATLADTASLFRVCFKLILEFSRLVIVFTVFYFIKIHLNLTYPFSSTQYMCDLICEKESTATHPIFELKDV